MERYLLINNENISVEVLYDEEDFWLTQKSMSKLFNVEVNTINYHLKKIFEIRAVSGYFDYIEDLVERENTFTMEEFYF